MLPTKLLTPHPTCANHLPDTRGKFIRLLTLIASKFNSLRLTLSATFHSCGVPKIHTGSPRPAFGEKGRGRGAHAPQRSQSQPMLSLFSQCPGEEKSDAENPSPPTPLPPKSGRRPLCFGHRLVRIFGERGASMRSLREDTHESSHEMPPAFKMHTRTWPTWTIAHASIAAATAEKSPIQ